MTNKEIANVFNDLAKIMELHDENSYRIRSYSNAYIQLRKVESPLTEMSDEEISKIKGVGNAISSKIRELQETGTLAAIEKYKEMTPEGIQEMLKIKGFGPKKVKVIWKDLGAESIGELLYACNENRLIELNGFGAKTQADLKKKLEYFQQSRGKFHYAKLEREALILLDILQKKLPEAKISFVGALRRANPILEQIELLIASDKSVDAGIKALKIEIESQTDTTIKGRTENNTPVCIYTCELASFGSKLFRYTGEKDFMDAFLKKAKAKDFKSIATEEAVFEKAKIPFIYPERREGAGGLKHVDETLITDKDIKYQQK